MVDLMDGPSLKSQGKSGAQRTWLVATLDDHSRLSPHAQFYPHQKITALLDCLRQAFQRRGLSEALYTDQGKIFTGSQLKIVCANLGIRLLHARPYAAWSKGKIERFFRTLQESFLSELSFEPATELEQLNNRLWNWIENTYHRRTHAALGGKSPLERFSSVRMRPSRWRLNSGKCLCICAVGRSNYGAILSSLPGSKSGIRALCAAGPLAATRCSTITTPAATMKPATDNLTLLFKSLWGASTIPFCAGARPAFGHPD